VLLDFWGTWCPPCVASVPDLRNLYKRYANEPSFVFISISSDGDEGVWQQFTEKNKMVWPQYRDQDRRILRAFGVRAFPSYILIDHEGIVRRMLTGWQPPTSLDEMVKRQVKIIARNADAR